MDERARRVAIAQETVAILKRGSYTAPSGREISIEDVHQQAVAGSILYRGKDFGPVIERGKQLLSSKLPPATRFTVANETTLAAARRLAQEEQQEGQVLALNFASARNPGGGFLNGAQAQEESLARASGLYPCIKQMTEMYDSNRRYRSTLYRDDMIYSPGVPVFRDDEDRLLEEPYRVAFITAPAVNAGAVRRNRRSDVPRIEPVMRGRMEKVLTVALLHGHETLILGAWGCGVFQNDPGVIARWFYDLLNPGASFGRAFGRVHFAVLDRSEQGRTLRPFEELFQAI